MLYIIGLGLGDEQDITEKGAAAIRSSDKIFLESYTAILPGVSVEKLSNYFGVKSIILAHRETVESEAETILIPALTETVSFLVVGDPFGATTHTDLFLRAAKLGVITEVIHNASIMNAIGACGLQLYSFGQTVSIPFFRKDWQPDSWYDKIFFNQSGGLHTLCLLDIKVREPNFEVLVKTGKLTHDPPRFMTINTAIKQLLLTESKRQLGVCGPSTLAVGLSRVGQRKKRRQLIHIKEEEELEKKNLQINEKEEVLDSFDENSGQRIISGTLEQLLKINFGDPLHSLVIVGSGVHDLEKDMLDFFKAKENEPLYYEPIEKEKDDDDDEDEDE
jgi:diphthine methyl ester synthase